MYQFIWLKLKLFITRQPRAVRWTTVALILLVVCAGLFGAVRPAHALDLFGWAWDSVVFTISEVLLAIASVLGKFLVVLIDILIGIVQYKDFVSSAAVSKGWVVVRDLCNMFFVAVLLIIAFGTILRIESYKYQRLLPQLIIMAVLINFSKLIAGFLIDVSQVVLLTFVNAFKDSAAGNFVHMFQLKDMLGFVDKTAPQATSTLSDWQKIGLPLFAIVLLVVALFVMLAMIVVFIARIVYLWVLIVLSPLAYLLAVVPMGKQYASRWWSTFGKWVTTGPILAFFIWLALSILTTSTGDPTTVINLSGGQGGNVNGELISAGLGTVSSSSSIMGFIIAVALLVMAMGFAQALGGFAGKWAGSMSSSMSKLGSGSLKLGWTGVKSVGKKADQAQMNIQKRLGVKAPLTLRPTVWKEAWKDWRAQKEAEHYAAPKGAAQDMFHKVFSREKTNYHDRAVRQRQSEEERKILSNKDDEIIMELEVAIKEKNPDKIAGASRKLAKQADFDNFVRGRGYHTGVDGSAKDYQALIRDVFMKEGGMTEQEAYRLGNDVGELAEGNRQWGMARAYNFNPDTGKFSEQTVEGWANTVAAQQAKRDPQVIPRENHRTAYKNETSFLMDIATGNPIYVSRKQEKEMIKNGQAKRVEADAGFHDAGKASLGNIDPAHANRFQPNARAAVMLNHPEEAKQIAPVLYNKIWESMAQMTPEELEKMEQYTKQPVVTDPNTGQVTRVLDRKNLFEGGVSVPFEETSKKFWDEHLTGKFDEWKKDVTATTGRTFTTDEKSPQFQVEKKEYYDNNFLQGQHDAIENLRHQRLAGTLPPIGARPVAGTPPPAGPTPGPAIVPAPGTPPTPPGGTVTGTPLQDVDRTQYQATKAKAEEYQKKYKSDFFISDEYKTGAASGKFLEQERFDEAQALEKYKAEHGTEGLRGMANYGAKGSSNVVGMDFSNLKVEGMDLSKNAGEFISDPAVLDKIKPRLLEMIDQEMGELQAKPIGERTAGDNQRLVALQRAKDKVNDGETFKKLKLANLGRTGVNIRHVLSHEDMHEQLAQEDPDGELQKQIWKEMSPEARQIATQQVKRKMTNQKMTEAQVISEYFAEGLANAGPTNRADRSISAITLPPSALARLAEKVKVNQPGLDFDSLEPPAEISKGDMKRVLKTDRKQEKAGEKTVKKSIKLDKKAEDAQRDANAKTYEYNTAKQAREKAEKDQEDLKRKESEKVRSLTDQAKNEQALMQQAIRSGDKSGADSHRKNFNAISKQIEEARKRVQVGEQKLSEFDEKEELARLVAVQAMEKSIKKTGTAEEKNSQIDVTLSRQRAQRGVQNLRGSRVMDDASAAKVDSALARSDYSAAFTEMENARKNIMAHPETFSGEAAKLQDQIKRGNASLKLGVPGKMADSIKGDIAKWQAQVAELTNGMTGQIDAIMKDMSEKIPEAKNLFKPAPTVTAPAPIPAAPDIEPVEASSPIAQLKEKIKTAQTSLRLGIGGKMAEQINQDMANWQSELGKLQSPMNSQITQLQQKIAGAQTSLKLGIGGKIAEQIKRDIGEWENQIKQLEFAKSGETIKLDKLASQAVKKNTPEPERKNIDQAVRQEMEKVAPSEAVSMSRPVQESAQHLEVLMETLKNVNISSESAQRSMDEVNKVIMDLSKNIQGSQKDTAAFVKHITSPLSKQAQAGSTGQFGVQSEEWKKFMYNMEHLYKFFRDKAPKKGGESDAKKTGSEQTSPPAGSPEE
ncbi:MAG: hypothetical protein V1668_01105 [Patescibacteria group bacterium]